MVRLASGWLSCPATALTLPLSSTPLDRVRLHARQRIRAPRPECHPLCGGVAIRCALSDRPNPTTPEAARNAVASTVLTPSAPPPPQRAANLPPCHEVTSFGVTIDRGMGCS